MRYVAAYLLAVLGGNNSPTAKNIKKILNSVGIDANDECINKVLSELNGKDVDDVVNSGLSRLACVPADGALAAAPAAPPAAGGDALAEEKKEEEKKEESEESDEDMGFGLFD